VMDGVLSTGEIVSSAVVRISSGERMDRATSSDEDGLSHQQLNMVASCSYALCMLPKVRYWAESWGWKLCQRTGSPRWMLIIC
jgi:hypothetical protein